METQSRILSILKKIVLGKGITDVFFAGNKIPPTLLAFAVHFPRLTLLVNGTYETQLEQNRKIETIRMKPNQVLFIPPNCWDKPDMSSRSRALHFLFGKRHTGISLVTSDTQIQAQKIALHHTLAGPVQRNFLPQTLPGIDGIRFACIYHPAEWVSGDIYDIVRLDEKHVGMYLIDAVGHSIPAALLTMFLKYTAVLRETCNK